MNMFTPAQVAENYTNGADAKVHMSFWKTFILAVFAGFFIAVAGQASTLAVVSVSAPSLAKFLSGCIFSGGLAMVILTGSELFTGNNLLLIPLLEKKISVARLLRNWGIVYLGNLVGSLIVAGAIVCGHTVSLFGNGFAVSVISTAAAKCTMTFGDAIIRGFMCNVLVCVAVWIALSAKDVAGKIIGLFFPIMIFVTSGFEHSVANMYYIAAGLFAKAVPAYAQAAADAGVNVAAVNVPNYIFANLLPVTIGNILGGAVFVGILFWFCQMRKKKAD